MAAKEGGRSFGFMSRSTPFRSERSSAPDVGSSQQQQYHQQPGDGYQQMMGFDHPMPGGPLSMEPWLESSYYQEALDSFNMYDPTFWLPTISFKVSGIMFWPWILITTATAGLTFYFLEVAPEHKEMVAMPLDAHVVMGGALSFLVVMRTDASMERWWEARCSWQTIVNCLLSIGAQTAPALPSPQATEEMLMQLMAFAISLKAWLRDTQVQRAEIGGRMDWQYIRRLNSAHNPPITALKMISHTVRVNLPDNLGSAIYDETSEQIRVINHAVGACSKIKTTPMTYGYVTTLRSFLILWLVTLSVPLIGEFGWLAIPVLSLISFLFLNVEQMAVEIEQPFGDDANDLPIESYVMDLEKTLLEMVPGFEAELAEDEEDGGGGGSGDGGGRPLARQATTADALASRIAALESAWQAEHQAQAQTIHQLTAELTNARDPYRGPPMAATPGQPVPINSHSNTDWNKVSPMWQQSQGAPARR